MLAVGAGKASSRAIRSPPARAGRGVAAAEDGLAPEGRPAVGLLAATPGRLRTDKSAESGQQMITKIAAKTTAVNPSHTTSPASLDRLGPMSKVASIPIICSSSLSPEKRWCIH
jgi:hypothetical protein